MSLLQGAALPQMSPSLLLISTPSACPSSPRLFLTCTPLLKSQSSLAHWQWSPSCRASLVTGSPLTPQNGLERALRHLPAVGIANLFWQGHTTPSQERLISARRYSCDAGHNCLCQRFRGGGFIFLTLLSLWLSFFPEDGWKCAFGAFVFPSGFVQPALC